MATNCPLCEDSPLKSFNVPYWDFSLVYCSECGFFGNHPLVTAINNETDYREHIEKIPNTIKYKSFYHTLKSQARIREFLEAGKHELGSNNSSVRTILREHGIRVESSNSEIFNHVSYASEALQRDTDLPYLPNKPSVVIPFQAAPMLVSSLLFLYSGGSKFSYVTHRDAANMLEEGGLHQLSPGKDIIAIDDIRMGLNLYLAQVRSLGAASIPLVIYDSEKSLKCWKCFDYDSITVILLNNETPSAVRAMRFLPGVKFTSLDKEEINSLSSYLPVKSLLNTARDEALPWDEYVATLLKNAEYVEKGKELVSKLSLTHVDYERIVDRLDTVDEEKRIKRIFSESDEGNEARVGNDVYHRVPEGGILRQAEDGSIDQLSNSDLRVEYIIEGEVTYMRGALKLKDRNIAFVTKLEDLTSGRSIKKWLRSLTRANGLLPPLLDEKDAELWLDLSIEFSKPEVVDGKDKIEYKLDTKELLLPGLVIRPGGIEKSYLLTADSEDVEFDYPKPISYLKRVYTPLLDVPSKDQACFWAAFTALSFTFLHNYYKSDPCGIILVGNDKSIASPILNLFEKSLLLSREQTIEGYPYISNSEPGKSCISKAIPADALYLSMFYNYCLVSCLRPSCWLDPTALKDLLVRFLHFCIQRRDPRNIKYPLRNASSDLYDFVGTVLETDTESVQMASNRLFYRSYLEPPYDFDASHLGARFLVWAMGFLEANIFDKEIVKVEDDGVIIDIQKAMIIGKKSCSLDLSAPSVASVMDSLQFLGVTICNPDRMKVKIEMSYWDKVKAAWDNANSRLPLFEYET